MAKGVDVDSVVLLVLVPVLVKLGDNLWPVIHREPRWGL